MTFSAQTKKEILESNTMRGRKSLPFVYGQFALGKDSAESIPLDIITEAGRYGEYTPEQAAEFIAGAFLVCGNVTDPEKGYHAEFAFKKNADELKYLLDKYLPGAKTITRKSGTAIYYKEHEQIEDLLTMMGAPKACLAMIDVEIFKSMRNSANRATNCETANLDKLVNAASTQMDDITLLLNGAGGEALPENLLETARLRLENPEASIRELAVMADISRSGMHHRLAKISRMADAQKIIELSVTSYKLITHFFMIQMSTLCVVIKYKKDGMHCKCSMHG